MATSVLENWHVQWFLGDQIPAAVLAYEASQQNPHPTPEQPEEDMIWGILELADSPAVFIGPAFKRPDGLYSMAVLTWIEGTPQGIAGLNAQLSQIPYGGAIRVVQGDGSKYGKAVLAGMWVNKLPAGFVNSDFAGCG